jgi:hypothetical protein
MKVERFDVSRTGDKYPPGDSFCSRYLQIPILLKNPS